MPETLASRPEAAPDESAPLLAGHSYDGIKEYDNPMPRWWLVVFWITIAWSVLYVPGVHLLDWINTYEDDLARQQQMLAARRAEYESANPSFAADAETLARFVADEHAAAAGAVPYAKVCAACHGDRGQGLIGPNLTDAYWLHGGTDVEIYDVITAGVLDKGMPGWESSLTGEERAQLVAYIRSLEGTDPPGAKEPQGERIARE